MGKPFIVSRKKENLMSRACKLSHFSVTGKAVWTVCWLQLSKLALETNRVVTKWSKTDCVSCLKERGKHERLAEVLGSK